MKINVTCAFTGYIYDIREGGREKKRGKEKGTERRKVWREGTERMKARREGTEGVIVSWKIAQKLVLEALPVT